VYQTVPPARLWPATESPVLSCLRQRAPTHLLLLILPAAWVSGCYRSSAIDGEVRDGSVFHASDAAADAGAPRGDSGAVGTGDAGPESALVLDAGWDGAAGSDPGSDSGVDSPDGAIADAAVSDGGNALPVCSGCCARDNGTGGIDLPPPCAYTLSDAPFKLFDSDFIDAGLFVRFSFHSFTNVQVVAEADDGSWMDLAFDALLSGFLTGTGRAADYSEGFLVPTSGRMRVVPRLDPPSGQAFYFVSLTLGGIWEGTSEVARLSIWAVSTRYGSVDLEPASGGYFSVQGNAPIRLNYDVRTAHLGVYSGTVASGYGSLQELLLVPF